MMEGREGREGKRVLARGSTMVLFFSGTQSEVTRLSGPTSYLHDVHSGASVAKPWAFRSRTGVSCLLAWLSSKNVHLRMSTVWM